MIDSNQFISDQSLKLAVVAGEANGVGAVPGLRAVADAAITSYAAKDPIMLANVRTAAALERLATIAENAAKREEIERLKWVERDKEARS